jgi:hypothetical protein
MNQGWVRLRLTLFPDLPLSTSSLAQSSPHPRPTPRVLTILKVYPINTPASSLPVIAFAVGTNPTKFFEVQKEDLGFAAVSETMQYGGIQSRGDSTFDILGDTWLKAVYAVFDQGNKRFGAVQRMEMEQNLDVPE